MGSKKKKRKKQQNNLITLLVMVMSVCVAVWAYSEIISTAAADQMTHKFKSPSFNGIGTGAHYLTIENQEKTRSDAIREKRVSDEEKRIAATKNTNYAKFINNLESRIYAKFSKEIEEAVFGEKCGTKYSATTLNNAEYSGGTASVVPKSVEEGVSDAGGDCNGTITFNGTTMTWKKVVTADEPYVELIVDGPDGGQTFNMPLNKLQF